jgi:hypothetical protein
MVRAHGAKISVLEPDIGQSQVLLFAFRQKEKRDKKQDLPPISRFLLRADFIPPVRWAAAR